MKKLTKFAVSVSLGALILTATSCDLLVSAAKKIAEYDPYKVEYEDDGSSLTISEPGLYKVENFHVDVSTLAKNYPSSKLYTYQINKGTSSVSRDNLGYIEKITSKNSSSDSDSNNEEIYCSFVPERAAGAEETVQLSENLSAGWVNIVPDSINDYYRNAEKYIESAQRRSRAADEEATNFTTRKIAKTMDFYVGTGTNLNMKGDKITGVLKYPGEHCLVYLADETYAYTSFTKNGQEVVVFGNNDTISQSTINALGTRFDDIYSKVTGIMGSTDTTATPYTSDVLQDDYDKVVIFIHDIGQNQSIGYGVGGYFYGADLLNQTYSNRCRMINVDSYFLQLDAVLGTKSCESTLAHEFTHMCNFINKTLINGQNNISWFTEMCAMTSEDILSSEIDPMGSGSSVFDSRLPYFNYAYFYGFNNWNNDYTDRNKTLATYANTYAMGAYFLRNFAPDGKRVQLIHDMATNKYGGFSAIGYALNKNGYITGYNNTSEVFDYAFNRFPQVLINAGDTDKATLFVSGTEKFNGNNYAIERIDLTNFKLEITDTITQKGPLQLKPGAPLIVDSKKLSEQGIVLVDLGSYGFDFHEYGSVKDMKKIDLVREKNKNVEFFIYVK